MYSRVLQPTYLYNIINLIISYEKVKKAESVTRKGNYVEAYQKAQKQKKARLANNSINAISYNTIFASNMSTNIE